MAYLKIGNTDFSSYIKSMKCDYETLLAEDSGRNAAGNNVVDVINRKWKINLTFIPMDDTEMQSLFTAIANYVVSIQFLNPQTKALSTITAYHSTPSPDYYRIINGKILFKELSLNFIEM